MAAAKKTVQRYVNVGGTWYAPGDELPADVAEQVTNPKVFEPEGGTDEDAEAKADTAESAPAKRSTAAK